MTLIFNDFLKAAASARLCFDSVRLLDFAWKRRRFLELLFRISRLSPDLLWNALQCKDNDEERCRLFSLAIRFLRVGNIYRQTGKDRTVLADDVVHGLADEFDAPTLMEVGVSDGSSSLALFGDKGRLRSIILTDRANRYYRKKLPIGALFYDSEYHLMGYKVLCFYSDLSFMKIRKQVEAEVIETVNPLLRERHGVTEIEYFNILQDVKDPKVQIVKCCNLLNKEYFSDEDLVRAVCCLARSVVGNGYIVIGQNNDRFEGGEAVFVLKRADDFLRISCERNTHDAAVLFADGVKLAV